MSEYVSASAKKKMLHDRIASAIRSSGKSQSQIADEMGVSRQAVSLWADPMGDAVPSKDIRCLYWLADVLDVDFAYLLNVSDIEKISYNYSDDIHDAVENATDKMRRIGGRITTESRILPSGLAKLDSIHSPSVDWLDRLERMTPPESPLDRLIRLMTDTAAGEDGL